MGNLVKENKCKKGRIPIRPFLLAAVSTLLIAWLAFSLSHGYPWGVDDGVKRLMARSLMDSGGASCLLPSTYHSNLTDTHFPVPPPFFDSITTGYRGIFPALWPALGGLSYVVLGSFGFYLLSAAALFLLLGICRNQLQDVFRHDLIFWILIVLAATLIFYGLTFWEHVLSLVLLIPLFMALGRGAGKRSWVIAGLCYGLASSLRPETALIFPWLWVVPLADKSIRFRDITSLSLSMTAMLLAGAGIEWLLADRWLPVQVPFNLKLIFAEGGIPQRIYGALVFAFDSAMDAKFFAAVMVLLGLLSWILKRGIIVGIGAPLLALATLIWGLFKYGAFGITASTQGLFFALPWVVISLWPTKGTKHLQDPMFIIGWGYLLFAYLTGPDYPGMHWGPRFLFPALLPLLFRTARVLEDLPLKTSRTLMVVSGIFVVSFGATSMAAVAQRGSASDRVVDVIRDAGISHVVLSRWHEGADLEPLWDEMDLLWIQGRGDFEELLIILQEREIHSGIGWLRSGGAIVAKNYPIKIVSQRGLPSTAGWRGDLIDLELEGRRDERWGEVYWHAGRRRVASEQLAEAGELLAKAIEVLPDNADLRYDYAVCLGQLGLISAAVEQLQEALLLDPNHQAAGELGRRLGLP